MTAPLISVVIPTRNRRGLLAQALRSVLAQTVSAIEVIVVDEGSSDRTQAFLATHEDPRVVVVRHDEPQGPSRARNAGVERSRGRFTAFLDDDDLWAPRKLEAQLEVLSASAGAGWAATGAVRTDQRLRIVGFHRLRDTAGLVSQTLNGNVVSGSCSAVMVRTRLLREAGGFNEGLLSCEDWDCWIRLANMAPLAMADAPLVAYRVWPSSRSHIPELERRAMQSIHARHEALAAELDVRLDSETFDRYAARQELQAGRRGEAVRGFLALARRRRRYLLWAAAAAVAPRDWESSWTRLREPRLWPGWRRAADAWLQPYRAEEEGRTDAAL